MSLPSKGSMKGSPTRLLTTLSLCLVIGSPATSASAAELLPGEQQIVGLQAGEGLGDAIAIQSNEAFLGAPYYSNARGRVQFCVRSQAGVWSAQESMESPNPVMYGHFGLDVAIAAHWLAVTELSPRDTQGFDVGRVYLYKRIQGHNWQLAQTLTAPARPPREVNGQEVWFKMQFGSAVEMWGDNLVVQDDMYAGNMVTTTLRIYRLRYQTWEPETVIENVSTRPEYMVPMPMAVQYNSVALGDPWWCNKLGWNSGRVQLFRFTGIPGKGKWALEQMIEPPELSDSTGMGRAVGFSGFQGDEVMMGASRGFWTSGWNGKRWSKPGHVEVPEDKRQPGIPWTPPMAMQPFNVVSGNMGNLSIHGRGPDGWVLDQKRQVHNPHGLALSADTVAFWRHAPTGTPRLVSFLPLADLPLSLGKARSNGPSSGGSADEREAISSGGDLRWQAWADGPVLPLEVDPSASMATFAPNASLSGAAAALFKIELVTAEFSKTHRFEIRPRGLLPSGDQAFTVQFTSSAAQSTVNVTWERTASGPTAASLPTGLLQKRGQRMVLSPVLDGFTEPTFIWRRDGKILADQTAAALNIAAAKPEHAGVYELEVRGTTEGADVIGPCYVAVYEPVHDVVTMTDEQTARLKTKVWGPVQVQWHKSISYDDPTSPFIAGVYQPTLTVIRGRFIGAELQENLIATATLVNPEGQAVSPGTVIAEHTLISVGRLPQLAPGHQVDWAVDEVYPEGVQAVYPSFAKDRMGLVNGFPGSCLKASGLPPGLELNENTGAVSGTFTKAGVYKVTWRLTDARGLTSAPVKSVFRVGQPPRIVAPGVYAGRVGSAETLPHFKLGGLVEITATENGCISGVLRLGADTRRFASKLAASPDSPDSFEKIVVLAPLRGTRSTKLVVRSSPGESRLTAQLVVALPGTGENWGENPESELTFRSCEVRTWAYNMNTFGRHTLLLSSQQASEQEPPMGSGFMSMSISTGLCVQVVGTLADGTGVTFSTPLMPPGSPIPYYGHEATRCSTLAGEILVDHWSSPIVGLNGQWMQAAKPASKNYPAGFVADLIGEGSLYIQPPAGVTLFSNAADAPGNASFYTDLFGAQLFRLTTDHRAVPHSTTSPNRLCKIDFYAPTGFYTGRFVVNEWVVGDTGAALPPRQVDFRGMVVPMLNAGRGFCCFPRILGGEPLQVPAPGSEPPLSQNVQIYGN